jgi:chromosome segregation protein
VHLKSLTLRGFKSFASATTLRFEPGITCVVGPNGAGKSNVVDALAWVMGEQGAKSLRGGKMDDVIFAGTAGRPPLGRAEVVLTIDNSDGALPIEYAEVTISRLMFRSGQSEYAVNGTPCRLLDIQELLSDSGIGREMHVIVGQGQLDAVLAAAPEDRRAFVEEAAGVLKHRKRKEKALRKLEAMAANLARLTDLSGELRRQLKPLGRQAEVARRAAVVQADRRDARLRLLADDLLTLESALAAELADESAARAQRAAVEADLAVAREAEEHQERVAVAVGERLAAAQDTWYGLRAVQDRLQGTAALARERHRHLSSALADEAPGRDPDELDRDAAAAREHTEVLAAALAASRAALDTASATRIRVERELADAEEALVAAVRAAADRREGLARLAGQVAAARSRTAAGEAELGRLAETCAEAQSRAQHARAELSRRQTQGAALEAGELALDQRHEAALATLAAAESRLAGLVAQERDADRDRSAWAARYEALAVGLARKDGAGALLGAQPPVSGVLGAVVELLRVQPGAEAAVAAALSGAADAVAVASLADAAAALTRLRDTDGGQVNLWIAQSAGGSAPGVGGVARPATALATRPDLPPLPAGFSWVLDVVTGPEVLAPALVRLLDRVTLAPTLAEGVALIEADPSLRAVTRDGDLIGVDWAAGGSASAPSLLALQAAVDEARHRLDEATHRTERLRFALATARQERDSAQAEVDAAEAALHESDARMAALTEQLALLGSTARAADGEVERITAARAKAAQAHERHRDELAALTERLTAAQQAEPTAPTAPAAEPSPAQRDKLAEAASQARATEVEARLAVRSGEERVRALAGRAESLTRAAAAGRAARARLAARRVARARGAANAAAVGQVAALAVEQVAASLVLAATERSAAEDARRALDEQRSVLRSTVTDLTAALAQLTDVVHRDEVARAEQQLRIEALQVRSGEGFGVPPDVLRAEYGPDVPVPPPTDAAADARPVAYDRGEQERRAEAAERALARLGRVNPLALEEFAALEERHAFLTTQLEDLQATRRDLLSVVRDVDQRIHEVFAAAFADTAREFEAVFAVLFPGGEGRLVLTDPTDLLTTGIEVEARPPGKKVKRLSLLSGGERSLTAIALLVAIFRARPSPFYVLDEVEAALDDVNLSRLLDLISSLRETSQLIVITHQKRTMEIADALYGVSMRGDGITSVISQRLREREPA